MQRLKITACIHVAFLLVGSICQAQIELYKNLDDGNFQVGFKAIELEGVELDERNLRISVWYPTATTATEQLNLSSYFNKEDEIIDNQTFKDLSTTISGNEDSFPQDSLALILEAKMLSFLDAPMAEGKFPLLLWSSRYGTVAYQAVISEYLASHGYVVAFAEDNPNGPYPWGIPVGTEREQALNKHVEDLVRAMEKLHSEANVNRDQIALLSWSYAGESAILTQIASEHVDAVVGFSAIGFTTGLYLGSNLETLATPEKLTVPYLMLFEKIAPNGNERQVPAIFSEMHEASRYIHFEELAHGSFNALEGMIPGVLNTTKVHSWSIGGETARLGYELACKTTLAFLESQFKPGKDSFDKRMEALIDNSPITINMHSPN